VNCVEHNSFFFFLTPVGKVTYQSRYLRSQSYLRNLAANRIVMGGLGTASYPDPCKTIFQRWDTWNIGWGEDQGCLEQIKLMTSANCCPSANGFIVCTEVLTRHHFEQVEVQTCTYCACAVHMQTNFTTLCYDGCVRGAYRILVNLTSGGSQPLGGIPANLYLSVSTVPVPRGGMTSFHDV